MFSVNKDLLNSSLSNMYAIELSYCVGSPFFFSNHPFFKDFYLFIFTEGKGGRKRERNINVWLPLKGAPYWGPGLQPRHVP